MTLEPVTEQITERVRQSNVAKKNPFRIGDAVVHLPTQQKGLIVDTRHDWVKFEVIGQIGPGGKRKVVRFGYRKLNLLATREQIQQGYRDYMTAMATKAKKANSPWAKFKRALGLEQRAVV
ncbi:hypothetical protein EKK58_09705 [Candidatus Dependentiae bacterium]|nr:MAG: hypothetical protein EKK58_09705 [Candidatus Dependentiae bacterium]